MNEIERDFKLKGTVSKRFTIPMLFWEEWEQDCRDSFNNTYHLKMQFDHEFRKTFSSTANLLMQEIADMKEELFEVKAQLAQLEKQPEITEKPKRKTFGGN
jgi:ppGpp synthetase/RelA/SpoT-type nucleotidyltranferase